MSSFDNTRKLYTLDEDLAVIELMSGDKIDWSLICEITGRSKNSLYHRFKKANYDIGKLISNRKSNDDFFRKLYELHKAPIPDDLYADIQVRLERYEKMKKKELGWE